MHHSAGRAALHQNNQRFYSSAGRWCRHPVSIATRAGAFPADGEPEPAALLLVVRSGSVHPEILPEVANWMFLAGTRTSCGSGSGLTKCSWDVQMLETPGCFLETDEPSQKSQSEPSLKSDPVLIPTPEQKVLDQLLTTGWVWCLPEAPCRQRPLVSSRGTLTGGSFRKPGSFRSISRNIGMKLKLFGKIRFLSDQIPGIPTETFRFSTYNTIAAATGADWEGTWAGASLVPYSKINFRNTKTLKH